MIEILHEHPSLASLSYLAFERATKKNRLAVSVGDFMYSRLVLASRNIEPELNSHRKKAELGYWPEEASCSPCLSTW